MLEKLTYLISIPWLSNIFCSYTLVRVPVTMAEARTGLNLDTSTWEVSILAGYLGEHLG